MDNTIDTLQIEIESSTTGGQRGITKLKNSLEKLAEMSEGIAKISGEGVSKLKAMADGVEALGNAGNNPGLSKAISELRKLSKLDFSGIATGSDKIKEIADAVDGQLANQQVETPAVATPASGQNVDILPGSEVAEKQRSILDFFKNIGAKGTSTAAKLKSVFSSAMSGIGKVIKGVGSAIGSFFGVAAKGAGKLGKLMVGSVMESVKKVTGKVQQFTKSIARIAMYRVVRMLLTQIANAFKEGTNNCYQYSKAIGGSLATSMDSMATSMLYFKNSIGAMVAPLLNALAPAIEYVIDKVVSLINALNQLFAKLTGASTWTKAIKTQTEYAESAGGAADAAKSLTAGFDELNVLSDSGGGGGASTPDYSSMFEEVQLDSDFASWADQIKEAINNGDWAGVGQILGDKVNSVVDSIDFAGVGTKLGSGIESAFELLYSFLDTINFDNIGAGIATLLNNAFEQIDFSLVGKTFAKKWTILVDLLYGFVTTFDWSKFGLAIADFINGWFEEIDLTKAVQTAQTLILGLFDALQSAIQNVEWYKIGTEIMDAIESIDWVSLLGELGKTLSTAVVGLLDLLLGVVGETDWGKVVQDICAGLGEMLANIDWGQILSKIGALIVELVVQIPSLIVGALGGIADLLGGLFEGFGSDSIAGFFYGIGDAMRDAGTWLKENLVDPVVNWVKDLFGIHSPSTVFADMGVNIIDGLWQGIKDTWHTITDFFSEKLDGIKQVCSDAWNSIKSTASTVWGNIKSSLSTAWSNIKESASTTWNNMKTSMSTTWENVKSNTSTAWSNIKSNLSTTWNTVKSTASTTWTNMKSTIGTAWDNMKTDASTKWNTIKSNLSTTWGTIKSNASTSFTNLKTNLATIWDATKSNTNTVWDSMKSSLSTTWNNIKTTATTTFTNMKTSITGIWDNLWSSLKGTINSIIGGVEKMANGVINGINGMVRALNRISFDIPDWVPGLGGKSFGFNLSTISTISIPRLANGGFPDMGQLFIAREAGAEMVGNIGGRTAVANNDQIVEGIREGVISAMKETQGSESNGFDIKVYLDGKQITAAIEKRQRERGAIIYPGGVLYGV